MFVHTSVILGCWQNDQPTLNTTDAVLMVGPQTGLHIIFLCRLVSFLLPFFRLFGHLITSIQLWFILFLISVVDCCFWQVSQHFSCYPPLLCTIFCVSMPCNINVHPQETFLGLPPALYLQEKQCLHSKMGGKKVCSLSVFIDTFHLIYAQYCVSTL